MLVLLGWLAQPTLAADADPFSPAPSLAQGVGTLQGEAPIVGTDGFKAALFGSVADDLVVFAYDDGGEAPILRQTLATELYGGYAWKSKARFDLLVPIYWYEDAPWIGYHGAALGDARLQATIPIPVGIDDVQIGVVPRLGLPTGMRKKYLGRGINLSVTGAASGTVEDFGWVANLGLALSPSDEIGGVTLGSTVDLLGGGWYTLEPGFRIGAETNASLGLAHGRTGKGNSFATGHLFAQLLQDNGVGMTLGAGTGLVAGIGAPDWRMFAAVSYSTVIRDQDRDGILDNVDHCPIDPEDKDNFEDADGCPETDNDKDGVVDAVDQCPLDPEDADGWEDSDGCPDRDNDQDAVLDPEDACPDVFGAIEFRGCPDTDHDGLEDSQDQCPEEAGPMETMGCPDRDKDLVPDSRDACPDEPKPPEEDPALSDGCPKRVFIVGSTIRITDKVFFEFNKAAIKPESFGLLDDVAGVLAKNPWVEKVEVAGHTDDKGADTTNLRLSQNRAQAVVDYLVKKKIAKDRLVAKGYGEGVPIDTNRTEEGRAANRRVEFNILSQHPPVTAVPKVIVVPESPTGPTSSGPWANVPGKLSVTVFGIGWADVYIDDVKVSKTAPFHDVDVAPGPHSILVVNARSNFKYEEKIEVQPGVTVTVRAHKPGIDPDSQPWGPTPEPAPAPAPEPEEPNPWK